MKTKELAIRSDGKTWIVREATLHLSDGNGSYEEYNHPSLALKLVRKDDDGAYPLTVRIEYQRNRIKSGDNRRASGITDTCLEWCECYAGHVELDRAERFEIYDRPYHLSYENKVRVALARKLGHEISERNLHLVSGDECVQAVVALEKLGVWVEKLYHKPGGRESVDLRNVENRFANDRIMKSLAKQETATETEG